MEKVEAVDYRALVAAVLEQYVLAPGGTHGVPHWGRVLENGRRLAAETGADPSIVQCFAILHDARRLDDRRDLQHGPRAAGFAASLRGSLLALGDADFELLHYAIAHHTDGMTEGEPTVITCWDADRLDLYRVGIMPSAEKLCTEAAKQADFIAWAADRGRWRTVPELVEREWAWRP